MGFDNAFAIDQEFNASPCSSTSFAYYAHFLPKDTRRRFGDRKGPRQLFRNEFDEFSTQFDAFRCYTFEREPRLNFAYGIAASYRVF